MEKKKNEVRILAVDDDVRVVQSLKIMLELHGYEIITAWGGKEAIHHLTANPYDIVLLNLLMPEVNGYHVMEFLAEKRLDSTVIVMSGDCSIDSAIQALRYGAHDFLKKPYSPDDLLRALRSAMKQRSLHALLQETERSAKIYRYFVERSPDIIYLLNFKGEFVFLNSRAENLLGYPKQELVGRHYSVVVHPQDIDRARHAFNERRTGARSTRNFELRLMRNSQTTGEYLSVEINATGVYDQKRRGSSRNFIGTYGIVRDVMERKASEEKMKFNAHHDVLTGLPNRALFDDRLKQGMAQARRSRQMLAVMFLDLDKFKEVNDSLGHAVGDILLRSVSDRLKKCLRDTDTLARIGGDEFMILLPTILETKIVGHVAEKILAVMREPFVLKEQKIIIGCSIGIALYPQDGDTIADLVKNADMAMYRIKGHDVSKYAFFHAKSQAESSSAQQFPVGAKSL